MTDGKKSRPLLYGPDGKPLSFSASTAPARKDHKTQQAPPKRARRPATKRNERSFGFWKTMISVLTIAASLVGLYAVYPRISVMPGEVSYNDVTRSASLYTFPTTVYSQSTKQNSPAQMLSSITLLDITTSLSHSSLRLATYPLETLPVAASPQPHVREGWSGRQDLWPLEIKLQPA